MTMTNKPTRKGLWLLLAGLTMLAVLLILGLIVKLGAKKDDTEPTANEATIRPTQSSGSALEDGSDTIIEDLAYTPDKFITGTEQLPKSLQGTQVDGEIIITDEEQLVPTRGLRRLFDYFLSALGEEDAKTIDARVEAYISNTTPQPAASEALKLYHQYQAYLKLVSALQSPPTKPINDVKSLQETAQGKMDLAALERQQKQVKQIRSQLFNSEVQAAFFGTEDQLHAYNKQMIEIAQDKSLSASEKQKAKQAYLKRLPESLTKKQAEQQANIDQLMTRTEQMKKTGADESQLFEMRTELVGVEAAERLAALDQQNQDFDHRFERYQQQKQKINGSNISQEVKQQQIKTLEHKMFNENEQKRLTGYEQFKNQSS
ncbi:MAG TPA: lipase secretion chaperone [Psychrobacter sp.]|nr:lipase secretion chaperone [Psychrobacter sp.]